MRWSCSPSTRSRQDDGAPDAADRAGRDQRAADPVVHVERLGLVADGDGQPRHPRPVPRGRAARRTTSTSTTAGRSCSTRAPRSRPCGRPSTTRRSRRAGSSAPASANARSGTRSPRRWDTTDAHLLRHRHPRLRRLLAQVPQRRQVPQGRRPDHGRRHDRQGDGPDRRGMARTGSSSSRTSATPTTEDELRAMEKRISDRGYYPVRLTRDEVDAWAADSTLVDTRFKAEMLASVERWMAIGDERLGDRYPLHRLAGQRRHVRDRPDHRARRALELGEANLIALDGFTLISTGWANPTRGTRSASCRKPSSVSGSMDSSLRRPIPTGRSSTSTLRRTARTSTTRPSSMPTCATWPVVRHSSRWARRPFANRSLRMGRSCRSTATSTRARAPSSSARPWRSIQAAPTRTASSKRPSSTWT